MKKLLFVCFLLAPGLIFAQGGGKSPNNASVKRVYKTPPKPVSFMKNLNDSASYVIGMSMAHFAKQFQLSKVDTALLAAGFSHSLAARQTLINENACFGLMNRIASASFTIPSTDTLESSAPLKTFIDSASYAIGMDRANFLRQQGITQMNMAIVKRGFHDLSSNKPVAINDAKANAVMNRLITNLQSEKVQPAIEEGRKFLATNKKRPGVKTTASGLQYEIIKLGTGIKPTLVDTFVAHYRGTLLNGTEFDASYNRNEPLVYGVTQVIKGWTEALQLMPVGSKFKLYIPYNLAYGVFDNPPIPGGSLLIFELELLDVRKKK